MNLIHTTVFSDGPGGGNPAPVFLEADSMTAGEMQQAAANLCQEAVFVLKPDRENCGVRLRYFVPDHELTICAHDTIGALTVLLKEGKLDEGAGTVTVQTEAGPFRADWEKETGSPSGNAAAAGEESRFLIMLEQNLPEFRDAASFGAAEIAKALRIPEEDLAVSPDMPAECVSTSRFKLMVPVKDRETLDSLEPDFEYLWQLCDACECSGFYVFARDPEKPDTCYARQFPCRSGYNEDPATGIAAAALGAYQVKHALMPLKAGWNRLKVYQGHAMGRPSFLAADIHLPAGMVGTEGSASGSAQAIDGVRVCGYAEILGSGEKTGGGRL